MKPPEKILDVPKIQQKYFQNMVKLYRAVPCRAVPCRAVPCRQFILFCWKFHEIIMIQCMLSWREEVGQQEKMATLLLDSHPNKATVYIAY